MKRDGRRLDHKTLEEIRRMAVQRVWEGEKPSVVIASYGFSRQIIYTWLREAKGKGRGLRALRSRKGTGRPRTLTAKQEQQLFRWVNGKDPRQHGFDFGLWTRLVVRKLIADGELRASRIGSRTIRVSEADLQAYLDARANVSPTACNKRNGAAR